MAVVMCGMALAAPATGASAEGPRPPDVSGYVAPLVNKLEAAVPRVVGENVSRVTTPGGTVTGSCRFTTTIPQTSFDTIEVVLVYTVTADEPAYAVGGVCYVLGYYGDTYGPVRAAAPGMVAPGAGTVPVPRDIRAPQVCNVPTGTWPDGTPANPDDEYSCTPLQ